MTETINCVREWQRKKELEAKRDMQRVRRGQELRFRPYKPRRGKAND